jgi:hypothetical protein
MGDNNKMEQSHLSVGKMDQSKALIAVIPKEIIK